MVRIIASLSTLIAAAVLVQVANATMTTVLPLQLIAQGGDQSDAALLAAAYAIGFALGCFTEPPRIQRVGYIRAIAAAAAVCTIATILYAFATGLWLWLFLRLCMGMAIASILASTDGWINATAPSAIRGSVIAVYAWCISLGSIFSQLVILVADSLSPVFMGGLAIAFNVSLVLVALTRSAAPDISLGPVMAQPRGLRLRMRGAIAVPSATAVAAAFYSGLVATSLTSVLPSLLSENGTSTNWIAIAVATIFAVRLLFQLPIGVAADRTDNRRLILGLSLGVALVGVAGVVLVINAQPVGAGGGGVASVAIPLLIVGLLGGLSMPVYAVAQSLAFNRASPETLVRVATTILLFWSLGSIAGPMLVAAAVPLVGGVALPLVIVLASLLMAALSGLRWRTRAAPDTSVPVPSDIAVTSVAATTSMAEAVQEDAEQAEEAAASAAPDAAAMAEGDIGDEGEDRQKQAD
ncbi:MFS transporter [Oceanomicrobium pacificus]|uniref:MFS transporter n=1 Tax=Oceanomicrobium pacificus TaxID=2692916 RepID=A0A6B0TWX7_9RHOB|nr:MFS transporter [Oceanomicrobium pacificus]MXU66235.1 MFS transporter [Oceanomicrobium pacificus]